MFTISVETHFCASHQLTLPNGSKETLHSHNWLVTANVCSEKLNGIGLVMDFRRLKKMLDNIVSRFGDAPLEKIDYFRQNGSSAENVAKYIYENLEPKLPKAVKLRHIKVVEEPGFSAKFSK